MKKIYAFTHFSHYLALITGLGYLVILRFYQIETQYGVRPNPWQAYWQGAHILVVPALIFAVGVLWKDHIYAKYKVGIKKKRKSGLMLIVFFFLMVLSGYLIQTLGGFEKVSWVKDFHLYTSLIWTFAYGIHQLMTLRPLKSSNI